MSSTTQTMETTTYPTIPDVPVFDNAAVTVDDVLEAVRVAGGCVIRNAVQLEAVSQIEKDVQPWLDADTPWEEGGFFPRETRRAYGLAGKSPTFVKSFVQHPIYQETCKRILTKTTKSWNGQKREVSVSHPQLNTSIIFSIGPGAKRQELHRDDMIHHNYPLKEVSPDEWTHDRETGIGWFVAGKKTTKANGATRFIPGSHRWDSEVPPNEDFAVYAELNPGDAFIMTSSCFHGGSANTTKDEERLVYCCFMTRGYLRQEENQYLANDGNELKKMYDMDTMKLLGWTLSAPFLGWVNQATPLKLLYPELPNNADLF